MPEVRIADFARLDSRQTVARLRESFFRASRAVESDLPQMASVETLPVDGGAGAIKARLYTPLGAGIPPGPGLVFFHGGGFMIGSLDSYDVACRRLAEGARLRVLSVDYRLAPEHRYPAAHEDARAAWAWAVSRASLIGMDPDRIGISGDSAGGNLAAHVTQEMNRNGGPAPAFQLLFYPLVQFGGIREKKMSVRESGFFLSTALYDLYRNAYLPDPAREGMSLPVSPLFAPDEMFRGLPPAHIVLAGWDPLRDEGQAYATRLAQFGVPVTVTDHPNMVHGFMNLTAVSVTAREAIREAAKVAGRALGARED
jgi:acetyl esterase